MPSGKPWVKVHVLNSSDVVRCVHENPNIERMTLDLHPCQQQCDCVGFIERVNACIRAKKSSRVVATVAQGCLLGFGLGKRSDPSNIVPVCLDRRNPVPGPEQFNILHGCIIRGARICTMRITKKNRPRVRYRGLHTFLFVIQDHQPADKSVLGAVNECVGTIDIAIDPAPSGWN